MAFAFKAKDVLDGERKLVVDARAGLFDRIVDIRIFRELALLLDRRLLEEPGGLFLDNEGGQVEGRVEVAGIDNVGRDVFHVLQGVLENLPRLAAFVPRAARDILRQNVLVWVKRETERLGLLVVLLEDERLIPDCHALRHGRVMVR